MLDKEELVKILEKKKHFILAIDGMCAAGKTTLAKTLCNHFGGHIFHMDDFFLPIEKRTKERYQEPGGNVDYERFLETVLIPLSKKQDVLYQRFDCSTMTLSKKKLIKYHPVNIIEGSYALHPLLRPYYTNAVILKITAEKQFERLSKRNPEQIERFIDKWIPLENQYFEYFQLETTFPCINIE